MAVRNACLAPILTGIAIMAGKQFRPVPPARRTVGPTIAAALVAGLTLVAGSAARCAPAQAANAAKPPAPAPRLVGYFAEWADGRGYHVADIPADKLTHVNYAFAVIRDGQCAARGRAAPEHFAQLRALKQKHPHLRTLISVGGWADSGPFSDAALTEASRSKFARSCAAFAATNGFDGVDIDWEYPGGGGLEKDKGRPEDTRNFTLLLAELRRALDDQGGPTASITC